MIMMVIILFLVMLVVMMVIVCACTMMLVWRSEDNLKYGTSPSTLTESKSHCFPLHTTG